MAGTDVLQAVKTTAGDVYEKARPAVYEMARFMVGIGFAVALLIVIGGLTWLIVTNAFTGTIAPPATLPPNASSSDVAEFKDRIADYKALTDIQMNKFSQLFQAVVVAALLPLLTLVLGYLFGKEKG